MLLFKGCPRCHGDLALDNNEMDDVEVYCLQCGFRDFRQASAFQAAATRKVILSSHESTSDSTKPGVPGDRRSRSGGANRPVLAGV